MPNTQNRTASAEPATAPAKGVLACVPWQAMAEQVAAWDALARQASEPNPFFESWYLLPSLRNIAGGKGVSILRFEIEGRLAGLLPVVRAPRYYRYPLPQLANWVHNNCFLGAPLVEQGCELAFWRALLAWADRRAGTSLFLHLRSLPLDGPLHAALKAVLAEQARPGAIVHREARALLSSPLSPESYLDASLTGKKRKELRRQSARLSELGHVTVERCEDGEGIAAWCEEFLALEAKGWKGDAGSALASASGTRALFVESLTGASTQGRLERLTLRLDGRPVAMLASFLTPPGAFSYKTAFDESFARYSPGVLLQRENLAILARPVIEWTDSCASADHPMIDHLWRERRVVGRYSIAIGGPLRRALFTRLLRAETDRATPASPPSEDVPA